MNISSHGVRRVRIRLEAGLATVALGLGVLTLFTRDWIELIFGVDPDGGSGSMEWLIVAVLFTASLLLGSVAGWEWRRGVRQASAEAGS
jgi:hypothetical protein